MNRSVHFDVFKSKVDISNTGLLGQEPGVLWPVTVSELDINLWPAAYQCDGLGQRSEFPP